MAYLWLAYHTTTHLWRISTWHGEGDPPILLSEVEEAINSLREGKSPGIDSVQCTSRAAQTWRANYN